MEYYTLGLCAVNLILLIALLVVVKRQKGTAGGDSSSQLAVNTAKLADISNRIDEEFERSRREMQAQQRDMRAETAENLGAMNAKLAEILRANIEHQGRLTATLTESLGTIRLNNIEQNEKQSRVIREAMDKMLESNEKKLEQMRATVDEKLSTTLNERLDSSFKTVSQQLENVYKSLGEMRELSNGVTANVTTLNRVLTNVKARGTWAEVQLGTILDQTIPNMYETNFAVSPSSRERVEFAIRIPAGDGGNDITYLPIDSKFPMEDYIRLCAAADAADAEELAKARKALENRILDEAKTVAKYINIPVTTPFAIMYLATEGLYAEIVSSRNGISEKIQNDYNIMIAGPTTITALLNSLSMGFKTVAINEKANEVRLLLAAAKAQYENFGGMLDKAKKKIVEAGESIDKARNRSDIINKKLRGVEALGEIEAKEVLGLEEITGYGSDNKEDE